MSAKRKQKVLIEEHWGQQALINAYLSTERVVEIKARMDALVEQHRLIGKQLQQLVFRVGERGRIGNFINARLGHRQPLSPCPFKSPPCPSFRDKGPLWNTRSKLARLHRYHSVVIGVAAPEL